MQRDWGMVKRKKKNKIALGKKRAKKSEKARNSERNSIAKEGYSRWRNERRPEAAASRTQPTKQVLSFFLSSSLSRKGLFSNFWCLFSNTISRFPASFPEIFSFLRLWLPSMFSYIQGCMEFEKSEARTLKFRKIETSLHSEFNGVRSRVRTTPAISYLRDVFTFSDLFLEEIFSPIKNSVFFPKMSNFYLFSCTQKKNHSCYVDLLNITNKYEI